MIFTRGLTRRLDGGVKGPLIAPFHCPLLAKPRIALYNWERTKRSYSTSLSPPLSSTKGDSIVDKVTVDQGPEVQIELLKKARLEEGAPYMVKVFSHWCCLDEFVLTKEVCFAVLEELTQKNWKFTFRDQLTVDVVTYLTNKIFVNQWWPIHDAIVNFLFNFLHQGSHLNAVHELFVNIDERITLRPVNVKLMMRVFAVRQDPMAATHVFREGIKQWRSEYKMKFTSKGFYRAFLHYLPPSAPVSVGIMFIKKMLPLWRPSTPTFRDIIQYFAKKNQFQQMFYYWRLYKTKVQSKTNQRLKTKKKPRYYTYLIILDGLQRLHISSKQARLYTVQVRRLFCSPHPSDLTPSAEDKEKQKRTALLNEVDKFLDEVYYQLHYSKDDD